MRTTNCCTFSASWENLRHRIEKKPLLCATALLFWLFWLWQANHTPYGLDDWQWGVSIGLEQLKTASLNSRYAGNALEVIVSRSKMLKTLLMGSMEALTPLFSVLLVQHWRKTQGEGPASDRFLALLLVMANLVYLTLPREIRAQTYGWVAGFSNYGFSAFLLVISQGILLSGRKPDKKHSLGYLFFSFFIGLITQLVLENITIFMVALAVFAALAQLISDRRCSPVTIAFLLGVVSGALIMFSGNIYSSLLTTGHTEGVGRYLSFPVDMKLTELIPFLYYRALYLLPGNLWGNNWLACTVIALCMAAAAKNTRLFLRVSITGICLCFALFFILNRFVGPIESYVPRWSDVLSQRLHFLFFWMIIIFVVICFHGEKKTRSILLFLWFLSPLAIAPMAAVTSIPGRCFLPSAVFLGEFCLLLLQREAAEFPVSVQKIGMVFLAAALAASAVRTTVIFSSLGKAERQREALIDEAKNLQLSSLYLPDYPYEYDHAITEPLKGGGQLIYFREFYQIPDDMELVFDPAD